MSLFIERKDTGT